MGSLRNQALQRELTRIEDEAREHSMTAIIIAAELEAAEQLCVLINAGMEADRGVKPSVIYYGPRDARVAVYTHSRAVEVLQSAAEAALEWTDAGDWGSEAYKDLAVAGFYGVHLIIEHAALAHYLAGLAIEQAAA